MIIIDDELLDELPIYSKEQYDAIEALAEQTGTSMINVTKNILKRYLRTELPSVVQMLIDKYFDCEYPKLILEFEKSKNDINNKMDRKLNIKYLSIAELEENIRNRISGPLNDF